MGIDVILYLKASNRFDKTIVFCDNIDHAERMRQALVNENADLVAQNHRYVVRITGDNEEGKMELDNFIFPESKYPVIATTSRLMTTGVDAQSMNKHTAELLEKHFDTAFAAPDGIKKLRELILTIGMQGKLVPQDPNEQPAKELLQEIEAEKKRRVKVGEIKKPKFLPPLREEEEPYPLPQGWVWARLQSFSDYNGRPNIDPSEIAEDTWLLDLEDIEKETSRLICRVRYSQRESKSTKSTFNEGDVLYGKLRPYLDKVLVADSDEAGWCRVRAG